MPSPRAALRLFGDQMARRIKDISYDPAAVTSWEKGDLSGKLRQVQKKIREARRAALAGDIAHRALKFVEHCSRRLGKTFELLVDACETGLREMNAPLKFAGPTREQIKNIARPIFREITLDCPSGLRPIWKAADHRYVFPKTGTELVMEGCSNGHEENLRGTACRKAYVDEAQSFKKNLRYVVQDILMPQILTTGGHIIIAGSSPTTPVHDFAKIIHEAQARGAYVRLPIWEAGYDRDLLERFMAEAGGEGSTTWRREYLCDLVVDEASSIIPEWRPEYERVPLVDERWQFWTKYVAMDIGGRRDRTAALLAWYDFARAKVCVKKCVGIPPAAMTTQRIAEVLRSAEVDIFGNTPLKWAGPGVTGGIVRVADNNNEILLKDLGTLHGLHFAPTRKDTLEAMVNEARLWVGSGRVEVDPDCVELLGCLRYGVWNERRTEFERFAEDSEAHQLYGHFDSLAAFIYLVRNVDQTTNPVPHDFKLNRSDMHIPPPPPRQEMETMAKIFRPRFRRPR